MATFALAHLRNLKKGPDIVDYLKAVDATLEPFGGRVVVFGRKSLKVLEGNSLAI